MKRRSFLAGIIAASAAPAIVRASSLMPIVVPKLPVIVRPDNIALQYLLNARDGSVHAFMVRDVPAGWLPCDGRVLTRAAYPALFAQIGNTFGDVPGGGFRVPDLRGHFARGPA